MAIAMLDEVPTRFRPESSPVISGQTGIVFKGALEQASIALETCFKPPDGNNIGWAEARK